MKVAEVERNQSLAKGNMPYCTSGVHMCLSRSTWDEVVVCRELVCNDHLDSWILSFRWEL